ncbi:unnamed protein product [Hymenolepis diminuta]|uniref:RNAse_A_bac domain-containing protein n=1 Tax=Hymenolepis diminuta TaxID=6216 RepID=A0A0R3S9C0_HYMDI|nr:unnamed protein product [Hymenolepis diminuta]
MQVVRYSVSRPGSDYQLNSLAQLSTNQIMTSSAAKAGDLKASTDAIWTTNEKHGGVKVSYFRACLSQSNTFKVNEVGMVIPIF